MDTASRGHVSTGDPRPDRSSPADEPLRLDLALVDAFAAFGPAYRRWIQSRLGHEGPSLAGMRLIKALSEKGPLIMSDLGHELDVTARNVTALVDGLEEDGLVRRRAHPTDRRATIIELTERGTQFCGPWLSGQRAALAEVFTGLSERDQRQLLRVLRHLHDRLVEIQAASPGS